MGRPYDFGPVEFEVPGGEPTAIELRVPHRGIINAVRLNQLDGSGGGTFRLLTSERAALSITGSSQSSAVPGEDPDAYSVFGAKEIVAGKYEAYGLNHGYRNSDGTFSVPIRKLWLVIEPVGDGTYSLAMTIDLET